jgi:hypothetical protein
MKTAWKITAVTGVVLISVCLVTSFACFRFDFMGDHYGYLVAALMLGTLISMAGIVGWATKLEKRQRFTAAVLVFIYPWAALFTGYLIVPRDGLPALAHMGLGPLILLSWVLAFVLLIMSAAAKPRS